MKTTPSTLVIAAILASATSGLAETPAETLEQGVFLEETQNDPAAAAEVYRKLLEEEAAGRLLAAEARYRLALCLTKLGESEQSREVLEELVGSKDAGDWASKAAKLLERDSFVHPGPWKPGQMAVYQILGPAGQHLGSMVSAIEKTTVDGEEFWTSYFIRTGGQTSFSKCLFSAEDYSPIKARTWFEGFGGSITKFGPDGLVEVIDSQTGELRWDRKATAGETLVPTFDNDQAVHLLQAVPQEIGTKVSTEVVASLAPAPVPFQLEVTENALVETDAGDFECVRIETNIGQDFLVSTAEHHQLISMEIGAARVEAKEFLDWNSATPSDYHSRKSGITVSFPAGLLWAPPEDKEDKFSVVIFPTSFCASGGRLQVRPLDIIPEAARKSASAFARQHLPKFEKEFNEFEQLGELESISGGDFPATATRIKAKQGELELEYLLVYGVTKEHCISLRFELTKDGFEGTRDLATDLIKGIRFD